MNRDEGLFKGNTSSQLGNEGKYDIVASQACEACLSQSIIGHMTEVLFWVPLGVNQHEHEGPSSPIKDPNHVEYALPNVSPLELEFQVEYQT